MPTIDTVAGLVDELRGLRLLEAAQLNEVLRDLQPRYAEPRLLAKEILQRGWLTSYQINRLCQGRGRELVLGSYVLLEPLGEGGMGQVFKARHQRLDRIDAVKVIRKQMLANPTSVERFRREARAAARLSHPNVITVYDAGEVGETHFLAMEYVAGSDLSRLLKTRGPLPVRQACGYIRQAALGLQHAYERGLTHRDIKPSNLLLTADGSTVKLLDLGLARLRDAGGPAAHELTDSGAVVGTADYIAPEQARNPKEADTRADIYSLGCSLYYLLAGHSPFTGDTLTEKLLKHQLDEPQPLERVRADVPPELLAVLRKLMAKRPQDRYQTPAEVAAALVPFAAAEVSNEAITPLPPQLALPVAVPVDTLSGTPTSATLLAAAASGPQSRRGLVVAAVSAVAAIVLIGVLWIVLRPSGNKSVANRAGPTSAAVPTRAAPTRDSSPTVAQRRDPQKAREWHALGNKSADAKNYDKAIAEYSKAIEFDPDFARAYFDRATMYYHTGDMDKCAADNSTVIRLEPSNAPAYQNRGTVYHRQKKYTQALDDFNTSIHLKPDYGMAYAARGNVLIDLKKFDEAIADLNKALELSSDRVADRVFALYNRGSAYYSKQQFDKAIADLDETIRLEPNHAAAFFLRAQAHEKNGNRTQAEADYSQAYKLDKSLQKYKRN